MNRDVWRSVAVSGSVGVAWLVVVALSAVVGLAPSAGVRALGGVVLPAGVTPFVWSWPTPWALMFVLAGAVAVALTHAAIVAIFRRGTDSAAGRWLATVAAGAAVGLAVDTALVFGTLPSQGWAMWSLGWGARAAVGAYFGLLFGWLPALVAHRFPRRVAAVAADPAETAPSPRRGALLAVAAVVALVLVGVVDHAGSDAAQSALRTEAAAAEPEPDGAQYPDPAAPGDPVPTTAPGDGTTGSGACTAEVSMLLLGSADAATGHRVQNVRLMNFSEEPCAIEGYPDIAFGDQNGHDLAVTIERGGSFMATDPGPEPIEVPAGGEAVTHLGWDAQSTQGALVARTLWAAPLAGDVRGSWPLEADIVEGTTVSVTAWELAAPTGGSPEG